MNKTSIFVKESLIDTLQISKTILMTMELYWNSKNTNCNALERPWDPNWQKLITTGAERAQIYFYIVFSKFFFLLSEMMNVKKSNGYSM